MQLVDHAPQKLASYQAGHTEDMKNGSLLAAVQPRARR